MLVALFAVIFWTIMFFIACVVSPKKAVKYKASSKNIKVTSKGVVTGVKKGKAVVTVTYMGVKQTVNVKVK